MPDILPPLQLRTLPKHSHRIPERFWDIREELLINPLLYRDYPVNYAYAKFNKAYAFFVNICKCNVNIMQMNKNNECKFPDD